MKERTKIEMKGSIQDFLIQMSEGNPGGLKVALDVLTSHTQGFFRLLDLDDMNIRGEQIWVGYKDHCGQDLERFMECIKNRSPEMIETINKQCGSRYTAVTSGASYRRDFL